MLPRGNRLGPAILLLCALAVSRAGAQGPPYQTDDPVPVDLHHYEFYIFGGVDGTTAEIDSTGRPLSLTGALYQECSCMRFCPGASWPLRITPSIFLAAPAPMRSD